MIDPVDLTVASKAGMGLAQCSERAASTGFVQTMQEEFFGAISLLSPSSREDTDRALKLTVFSTS